jgi:hypothetical protein
MESKRTLLTQFFFKKMDNWRNQNEKERVKKKLKRMIVCDICEQSVPAFAIETHFKFCKKLFKNERALNDLNVQMDHSFEQIKRLNRSTSVLIKIQRYPFRNFFGSNIFFLNPLERSFKESSEGSRLP